MQSAFYCGGPAALEAFRNTAEVFAAMDAEATGHGARDDGATDDATDDRARAATGASQ
jgi:hypothetical protein